MQRSVAVLFSVLLCPGLSLAAPPQEAADKIVARIGDFTVTAAELERQAAEDLADLRTKRHEVLAGRLEQMVSRKLIDLEAAERGLTSAQLLQAEVEERFVEPSDEEIQQFYEQNKARIPATMTFEQVQPELVKIMRNQQRQFLYSKLVGTLRAKFGATTHLPPLRFDVEPGEGPSWGPSDAAVTIVEFSDFECPYCQQFNATLAQVKSQYEGRIRVVFRQFPLTSLHPDAMKAAEAALCADEQGKFWEMHDAMFEDQQLAPEQLLEKAESLGLDEDFATCLESSRLRPRVDADMEAGRRVGVTGTPAVFINGRPLKGAVSLQQIVGVIEEELQSVGSNQAH